MRIISYHGLCLTAALLTGCQGIRDKSDVRVSGGALDRVDPPGTPPAAEARSLPVGCLPGTDKIYFVGDEHIARRETDSRPVLVPEATRRLLVGDADTGDVSYQPALLPRELAEELARSREINRQNRALMLQMMMASRDLVAAMNDLKQYNRELEDKLKNQIAYAKSIQAPQPQAKADKKASRPTGSDDGSEGHEGFE